MKGIVLGCALAATLGWGAAHAQNARVEAVQYPAWLERGGYAVPLAPGIALRAQDRLRTGANARVLLRLGEGSSVKLGEHAQFVVEKVERRGIFRAALSVIAGAFRFTTAAIARHQGRDINIKVSSVTAGIRGTDVWGKSTDAKDLICLLEGKVSVGSEGNPTVTLDQRADFYQKPRGGPPEVAKVDEKQIATWSKETEIAPDGAAGRVGGTWRVVASKLAQRDSALALNRILHAAGYPSRVAVDGEGAFLVQVTGLAGEAEARALMANLRTVPGVTLPTVSETPAAAH